MAEPWLIGFFACNREMQAFSFLVGYSLWGGISGRVRALNLTVPLGSGWVGSDNLGYGPGSGFSFEPVQTSTGYQHSNKIISYSFAFKTDGSDLYFSGKNY